MGSWHRDVPTEQLLKNFGIPYEYRTGIPIKKLKLKESLTNNARLSMPLDEDVVLRYAHSMSHGSSFPAGVITQDGYIYSGNQRYHASQLSGQLYVDAYVVGEHTDFQRDNFVREANVVHGKPSTDDEKIASCIWLHSKHSIPLRELAGRYFGGNEKAYGRLVNANMAADVARRLDERHIKSNLPVSTLSVMHDVPDLNVLCDLYHLACDFSMPASQVDEIVSIITKKRSEPERHKVVQDRRSELTKRVRTGVVNKDVIFEAKCRSFLKFLKGANFPTISKMAENDRKRQTQLAKAVNELINELRHLKGGSR